MMQQTRRRRVAASISPVGKTVLPLSAAPRGDGGGNTKRAFPSFYKRRLIVVVAVLVILIIFIVAASSLYFLLRTGNTQQVVRISSTDHANMTEFIPCIDDVSVEPYFSKIDPVLAERRKKERNPAHSELSCSPSKKQCFRGVYDGFDNLLELAQQNGDGHTELHNRIAVLIESLISKPGVPLQRDGNDRNVLPSMLINTVHRRQTYQASKKKPTFEELHADYLESASYVYTAILYDDTPDNLIGGETALVNFRHDNQGDVTFGLSPIDSQESKSKEPIVFTDGLIVEPKSGRLVLFSSGAENFHAPMTVRQGNRPCYHFWFKCKEEKT
eukprot:scaffold33859_cov166-Skeletonema_menzelii.AAC.2